jgi:hypothetical protein
MSVNIQLDTNAVNTLFPEGTEARVKLQQAVLSNVINAHIKTAGANFLLQEVNLVLRPLVQELTREYFDRLNYDKPTESLKQKMTEILRKHIDTELNLVAMEQRGVLHERVEEITKKMMERVDVELEARVTTEYHHQFNSAVAKKLATFINQDGGSNEPR